MMTSGEDSPCGGRLRPRKLSVGVVQRVTRNSESKTPDEKQSKAITQPTLTDKPLDKFANKFLCPYCEKYFSLKSSLSKHITRLHSSASSVKCQFCDHLEPNADGIVRHMADNHPNVYFVCLDCHNRFHTNSDLEGHKQICNKNKLLLTKPYRNKLRAKTKTRDHRRSVNKQKDDAMAPYKDNIEKPVFNGIVISCELKPLLQQETADIEDNITTNVILPSNKNLRNSGFEKNAVIVLDDIQWKKRIPSNFCFHNNDADQILSRLGVVHRSPRVGESTRRDWYKQIEDSTKFEKCFDTSFYTKVASNVHENLTKFLDGSFNRLNQDHDNIIKTRKAKNSVAINTVEGFPTLLACDQYSRSVFDSYLPRTIAPRQKWKWEHLDLDRNSMNPDQIKRYSHVTNCIITLVSSLDIWTQLCMRDKYEAKFNNSLFKEKNLARQNIICNELKEILESREIPKPALTIVNQTQRILPKNENIEFAKSLGLIPSTPVVELAPAKLSGECVRPRCFICCACGERIPDFKTLDLHKNTQHPNAQVSHYEIVGEVLLKADIMKHLYVPPPQPSCTRTRPPRGIKECTKCNKQIALEDLHQHILDCAGDTPVIKRKCRPRAFGARRRRTRMPDNAIRKQMRKDIRNRQNLRKNLLRTRARIRTEVGDAETIRKMLADLPAKRHRVTVNPIDPTGSRRRPEQTRTRLLMMKRAAEERYNARPIRMREQNSRTKIPLPNKAPTNLSRTINTKIVNVSTSKKEFKTNTAKLRRTLIRKAKNNQSSLNKRITRSPSPRKLRSATSSSAVQTEEVSMENFPKKIDISSGSGNFREHAARDNSNGQDRPSSDSNDQNRGAQNQQPQNVPLKHSIARLTANTETHDKSVQFQPHFLVQQECYENIERSYMPVAQPVLFENESAGYTLDKPPLEKYYSRCQIDNLLFQKNKSNLTAAQTPKPRKKLNDCIAMLKNKLVDPVVSDYIGESTERRSVHCDTADMLHYQEIMSCPVRESDVVLRNNYDAMLSPIPPAHANTNVMSIMPAPLDLSGRGTACMSFDSNSSYETLDLSYKNVCKESNSSAVAYQEENNAVVDLRVKPVTESLITLDLSTKTKTMEKQSLEINIVEARDASTDKPILRSDKYSPLPTYKARDFSSDKSSLSQDTFNQFNLPTYKARDSSTDNLTKPPETYSPKNLPTYKARDSCNDRPILSPNSPLNLPPYKARDSSTDKTILLPDSPLNLPTYKCRDSSTDKQIIPPDTYSPVKLTTYKGKDSSTDKPNLLPATYSQLKLPTYKEDSPRSRDSTFLTIAAVPGVNLQSTSSTDNLSLITTVSSVANKTSPMCKLVSSSTNNNDGKKSTEVLLNPKDATIQVKNKIISYESSLPSTSNHGSAGTKNKEILKSKDTDTAKKIAMLPKEIVEILGTMPADSRNQLLNVLPQYMAQSSVENQPNFEMGMTTETTLTTASFEKSEIATQTNVVLHNDPLIKSLSEIDTVTVKSHIIENDTLPKSYETSIKKGIFNNGGTEKLCDNITPNLSSGLAHGFLPPSYKNTSQKTGNEKTASLRAVRIKTADRRKSMHQLPIVNINNENKLANIVTPVVTESFINTRLPALQQAEVTSSLLNKNKNIVKNQTEVKEQIDINVSTKEILSESNEKNNMTQNEDDQPKINKESICKKDIVVDMASDPTSAASVTENCINNSDKTDVDNQTADKQEPLAQVTSLEIGKIKFKDDEDSEDDISLALIVKQKMEEENKRKTRNQKTKQKSQVITKDNSNQKILSIESKHNELNLSQRIKDIKPIESGTNKNQLQGILSKRKRNRRNQNIKIVECNENLTNNLNPRHRQDQEANCEDTQNNISNEDKTKHESKELKSSVHDTIILTEMKETVLVPTKSKISKISSVPIEEISLKDLKPVKKCKTLKVKSQQLIASVSNVKTNQDNEQENNKSCDTMSVPEPEKHDFIVLTTQATLSEKSSLDGSELKHKTNEHQNSKNVIKDDSMNNTESKMISKDDMAIIQTDDHATVKPLRRSRRGKSLFSDVIPEEKEIVEVITPKVLMPFTKKQLIFSKMLLDEEKHNKMESAKEKSVILPTSIPKAEDVIPDNLSEEYFEKSSKKKSLPPKTVSQKKKKVNVTEPFSYANMNIEDSDSQLNVGYLQSDVTEKVTKKAIVGENKQIEPGAETKKLLESPPTVVEISINTDSKEPLEPEVNIIKTNFITSPTCLENESLMLEMKISQSEKRKSLQKPSSSKSKKIKPVTETRQTSEDSDTCNEIKPFCDVASSFTKREPSKSTCYSNLTTLRRTRSKSMANVSLDNYDPYDIDMEDKLLEVIEPMNKKVTNWLNDNQRQISMKGMTKNGNKGKKSKTKKNIPDINIITKNETPEANDSDNSSKSDVPLTKYVSENNKDHKNQSIKVSEEDKKQKNEPIKLSNDELNHSVTASTSEPNKVVEKDNDSSISDQHHENIGTKKKMRGKKKKASTADSVNVPNPTEDTERLKSEQFMESFGFFSERKPRKSNLLASKKISETFHIVNESDDSFSSGKERPGKKGRRKSTHRDDDKGPQKVTSSSSKKATRRKKNKFSVECVCTKEEIQRREAYCAICEKQYRRLDNFLRHKLSLFHITRMTKKEMNIDVELIEDTPNYLVVYKEHLQRLIILTNKIEKRNKELSLKSPDAPLIALPTMTEIMADARLQTFGAQKPARRGLSRDEALFLDCCELLNKSEVPPSQEHVTMQVSENLETKSSTPVAKLIAAERCDSKSDGDVDSITAKTILESEEVRNLENDLLSGFKQAIAASSIQDVCDLPDKNNFESHDPDVMSQSSLVDCPDSEIEYRDSESDVKKSNEVEKHGLSSKKTNKSQNKSLKQKSKRSKAPDSACEDSEEEEPFQKINIFENDVIDMFEDKFDKIKRKCRSQAVAVKSTPAIIECSQSRHKGKKKAQKKKMQKTESKAIQNTIMTKGALKGFESIKVSIPTTDINMSAITPSVSGHVRKKKKINATKKRREKKCSVSSSKYESDDFEKSSDKGSHKNVDVYEFMDDDTDMFEFRPSTIKERFKSTFKDAPSTSKASTSKASASKACTSKASTSKASTSKPSTSKADQANKDLNDSSASGTDGDDFVYMSDDYLCSAEETENSLLSCEYSSSAKYDSEPKKIKKKDAIEKNAVMEKIFKNNAVRTDKKSLPKIKEKPKTNLDQLFDSLLEDKPNTSATKPEKTSEPEKVSTQPLKISDDDDDDSIISTNHNKSLIEITSSQSSQPESSLPLNKGKHRIIEDEKETDKPTDLADDTEHNLFEFSSDNSAGVARHRTRRKCAVGKQNVLAETWSSESELDNGRSNSGESIVVSGTKKRRPKRSSGSQLSSKRGRLSNKRSERDFRKEVVTSAVDAEKVTPPVDAYAWSSDNELADSTQPRAQQHGWIVGNSHKKLVTMLAHAKRRKRDEKRHHNFD